MKTKLFTLLFFAITVTVMAQSSVSINEKRSNTTRLTDSISKENNDLITFYNSEIARINEEINAENLKVYKTEAEIKSKNSTILKKEKSIEKLNTKISNLKNFTYSWFLPTKTNDKETRNNFFKDIYNNTTDSTHYVNSFSMSSFDNGVTAQSELVTDNLNWFRVVFGTLISAQSNSDTTTAEEQTQEQALTRLFNGGGNLYLEMTLPLATTYNGNGKDLMTGYLFFQMKGAADIKGFGNNIETSTTNGSVGFNGYLGVSSDNKKFNFFVQSNANFTFGNNDFYQNLNLTHNQGFINGKLIAGVTLLNKFRATAMISSFGSDASVRSGKVLFGLQIL